MEVGNRSSRWYCRRCCRSGAISIRFVGEVFSAECSGRDGRKLVMFWASVVDGDEMRYDRSWNGRLVTSSLLVLRRTCSPLQRAAGGHCSTVAGHFGRGMPMLCSARDVTFACRVSQHPRSFPGPPPNSVGEQRQNSYPAVCLRHPVAGVPRPIYLTRASIAPVLSTLSFCSFSVL